MHDQVLDWVGQFRTTDDLAVLDIGGRDLNGNTRMFFPNAAPYRVLDLRPGKHVDIVADATTWQPDQVYDLVLCTETFEHAKDWPGIIATAWNALRSGGWFIFTCAGPGRPTHSGVEAVMGLIGDEWYENVSALEIRQVLEEQGWMEIETHQRGLDTQGKAVKPVTPPPILRVEETLAPVRTGVPSEVLLTAALSRTSAGSQDTV